MKIWCQSCGAFGKDPVWDEYEKGLRMRASKITRKETMIELHGLDKTVPGIDRFRTSQSLCTVQSIRNAIRAEQEGYDAFVMISSLDAGFQEIREAIDLPVVFMLENCIHLSMMFAPKFAFLTHNRELLIRLVELTQNYGLAESMTPGGHLELSYSVWPDMFGNPTQYQADIVQKAREIISGGAGILIPSALPLSVWLVQQGLMEIDGVPILDAFGCALKMAELMVDFKKYGIYRKKSGPRQQDVRQIIQQAYINMV